MNTKNNQVKLTLAIVALSGLSLIGIKHIHTDILPMFGIALSYVVALGILGLAALDNRGERRLS
jgi:hypothetical protein